MLVLIPAMVLSAMPIDGEFRVVSVERREVYAGKLGRRIEQTLTAERDGVRYEIKLSRSHTRIYHSTRNLTAGDSFRPDLGDQVRKLD